jgi:hypothetical protein
MKPRVASTITKRDSLGRSAFGQDHSQKASLSNKDSLYKVGLSIGEPNNRLCILKKKPQTTPACLPAIAAFAATAKVRRSFIQPRQSNPFFSSFFILGGPDVCLSALALAKADCLGGKAARGSRLRFTKNTPARSPSIASAKAEQSILIPSPPLACPT